MNEQGIVNVALIGAGNIAVRHLANLQFMGGNRVVAICDVDTARAHSLADGVGARVYASYEEMFRQEAELDAVIVCTPPTIRRQIFELAAPRGVGVFVEKPPAPSLEEGRKIAQIVNESGIVCCVGFNSRYGASVDRYRELTRGRAVNMVHSVGLGSTVIQPVGRLDGWFTLKERFGGPIMDTAIHTMDLLRYLVGDIVAVQTFGNNVVCPKSPTFTIPDSVSSTMRFANGGSGVHLHSWASPRGMGDLTIIGPDWSLTYGRTRLSGFIGLPWETQTPIDETFRVSPDMGRAGVIPANREPGDPPDGYHYPEMKTFIEAVRTGDASHIRSPYADGLQSLAVVLAMTRSVESGQVEEVRV